MSSGKDFLEITIYWFDINDMNDCNDYNVGLKFCIKSAKEYSSPVCIAKILLFKFVKRLRVVIRSNKRFTNR